MATVKQIRRLATLCTLAGAGAIVRADTPVATIPPIQLTAVAQPTAAQEPRIKAAYLIKFTQYTTWPVNAFNSDTAPIIIGIVGTGLLNTDLEQESRPITKPRRIEIRAVATPEDAARCHAVFFSQSASRQEETWLQTLRSRAVLTVSETDQAIEHGSIIRLVIDNKKIRFDVSRTAMEHTELKLSTDLFRYARTVHSNPATPR